MSQSKIRNAVVLVIDRLGANLLGAYGSTWFETENFNRLAARSIVFDQAIASTDDLTATYQGMWNPAGSQDNLIHELGGQGVSSVLLTDDPTVEKMSWVDSFERVIPVQIQPAIKVADTAAETELASFFAQATQCISEMEPGSMTWIHSRGLSGAWDAPTELRTRLADSEDPDPPDFFSVPSRMFDPEIDDPDELLGYQQICAAQVTLIDDFLGVILDLLDSEIGQSTLFCLTATRGFPLGEHGLVGERVNDDSSRLNYSESVHVPMMICLPDRPEFQNERAVRNLSLIQPKWIAGCLADWFDESSDSFEQRIQWVSDNLPDKRREAICILNGQTSAIRTHAWKLIRHGSKSELYAKPDDRWEVNDVSRRCPHVVASLAGFLDQWIVNGEINQPARIELPEELAIRLG